MASVATTAHNYLNIGCGDHYSNAPEWTNVDFIKTGKDVIAHNLLKGLPFADNSFDLVYHSHVLEHFSQKDGTQLIRECYRVLKPGATIRIAVPNLEQIAHNYLNSLREARETPTDENLADRYDFALIEMYDQGLRNLPGGATEDWIKRDPLPNEQLPMQRFGPSGMAMRTKVLNSKTPGHLFRIFKSITNKLLRHRNIYEKVGRYRLGGEPHLWMYDGYSLARLLNQNGFQNPHISEAFDSAIPNWIQYKLDNQGDLICKPDSLFMEAQKPQT